MVYTWQCDDHKRSGLDDMTLLAEVTESAIVSNLRKRFNDDWIFTYIGPVLISVNPFKPMKYFTQREIDMYQGAATYENPPHIYALADNMYRSMTIDNENQCVIVSGESGAGKTVSAKYIMNYLSHVSGGGETAKIVKDVILQSNPLLEAFGNAKTVRNNNSSRFGKYVEIVFISGQPIGGWISNFLLEKSRVVMQNPQERNFHIFYQLIVGIAEDAKTKLGLVAPGYYNYLNQHESYEGGDINDFKDFEITMTAMDTMGLSNEDQCEVIQLVAGILHLGNIFFTETDSDGGGEAAKVYLDDSLDFPSFLLQIDRESLRKKLTSRVMESKWGSLTERVDVTNNVQQSEATRDALAKGLYARLFDYLIKRINIAMTFKAGNKNEVNNILKLGILDIYGFEIFQKNGFEQFCINFVNEKLQQIFIELTLKAEQEEYNQEGIVWLPISYFDNAVVCQLIEDKRPSPGIMAILDDVCASQHGIREGTDLSLKSKLRENCSTHSFYEDCAQGFTIHHYAGVVSYNVEGFCDRNKDVFYSDLVELMQSSESSFVRDLFPETIETGTSKRRPHTACAKIKSQANELMESLTRCSPHYIRCIKPNETKKPGDWEQRRVEHQVEYLGLRENVRVRRAGFAYRRQFRKFMYRYAILTKETWPTWQGGDIKSGIRHILNSVHINEGEFQMGKSKIFIKAPESLFLLEDRRERKINYFARVLQRAFRKYFNRQKFLHQKEAAADIFYGRKERRRYSLNRNFYSDYIGMDEKPELRKILAARKDKILFAQTVVRYDRKFKGVKKAMRDLVVTSKAIFLLGRRKEKCKGKESVTVVSRRIEWNKLFQVSLSTRQDDFVVLHVANSYDSLLQVPFKTEFVSVMKRMKEVQGTNLKIVCQDRIEFLSEKSRLGSGKKRTITFEDGTLDRERVEAKGFLTNDLLVFVAAGLPNVSRPYREECCTLEKQQQWSNSSCHARGSVRNASNRTTNDTPVSGTFNLPSSSRQLNSSHILTKNPTASRLNFNNVVKHEADNHFYRGHIINNEACSAATKVFMEIPDGGRAKIERKSILQDTTSSDRSERPLPANGRPKPKLRPSLARAKVIYDYSACDSDEITLNAGQVIEVVREDDSGWWTVKSMDGREGFFPGLYVRKM